MCRVPHYDCLGVSDSTVAQRWISDLSGVMLAAQLPDCNHRHRRGVHRIATNGKQYVVSSLSSPFPLD